MSETPVQAAQRHLALGRQPVPVASRDKRPSGGEEWQFRRLSPGDPDLPALFQPDANVGLMLGPASGGLADVDLDCPEAVALGSVYLPRTGMIHGRPSAPGAHHWFILDTPTDTQQFRAPRSAGGAMLVELRSSKGVKGFQTVIPPSIHPSGEQLAWVDPDGQPARIATQELLAYVKIVAAGALLARAFPKQGQRHEFALALAGALLRYGTDEEDAYQFVYEVCRVGGSTNPEARAATVRTTARKLAEGDAVAVTGIPRLIEIVGEDVAKRACDWLDLRDKTGDAFKKFALGIDANGDLGGTTNGATNGATNGVTNAVDDPGESDDELKRTIKVDAKGNVIACGHNAYVALRTIGALKGCFKWNVVTGEIAVSGYFSNTDPTTLDVTITDWLMRESDVNFDKNTIGDRILRVALENKFDPIQDYLRSIKWDGVPRLSTWLARYAGATGPIAGFVGQKWLISAAARALDPGCKADLVLIAEGLQGSRKSSLFETLGGEWYCDMTVALQDKDAKMLNRGSWFAELPDLASLKRTSEINAVKAFFSARVDKFRPPYGRAIIKAPRRTVYAGTTNDESYLSDITGNRRFCCVSCGEIDLAALIADRDQLFAEAVALYDRHVADCEDKLECCCWWPTKEEALLVDGEASKRVDDAPASELVSRWWCAMSPAERPLQILTSRVAKDALKYPDEKVSSRGVQMEVGHAMKRLKFKREHGVVPGQIGRCWHYVPTKELLELPQTKTNGLGVLRQFTASA